MNRVDPLPFTLLIVLEKHTPWRRDACNALLPLQQREKNTIPHNSDDDVDDDELNCAQVMVAEAMCSAGVQRVTHLRLRTGFDFFNLPRCALAVLRTRAKKNFQPAGDI